MTIPKRVLHFDCIGGVAGDMVIAAMLDLGLPLEVVTEAIAALPISGYRIRTERVKRSSVIATRFIVDLEAADQPHRHFSHIREMIEDANLKPSVKQLALSVFKEIAEAEARVHDTSVEKVHFHEVGAVDSIVDIVGAAAGIDYFGAAVTASPIPLGKGTIQTAHGVLPVPAPATLFILKGVPVFGADVAAELTTPTGAAILKAAAGAFDAFPSMTIQSVGFGAGTRTHDTLPGLLRAVLGERARAADTDHGTVVIEANIDDMTGELAAHVKQCLLEAAALDVWFEPIQMKKNRPALKVGVLCRRPDIDSVAGVLFRESSTIGLRYYGVGRIEMSRTIHEADTPYGPIRIKLSRGLGMVNAAPEFEDCLKAAAEHQVPVKQVLAVAAGIAAKLTE